MEIERKWMVGGWPAGLPLIKEQFMRQGYITVHPTVRIREEQNRVPALDGKTAAGETNYIVCFKTGQGIVRKETEVSVSKEKFAELEDQIGLPLIPKLRRTYQLPNGLKLEVNHVDEGMPTEFWYAEIEYPNEASARHFNPSDIWLSEYLSDDVSENPGSTMGAYWIETRAKGKEGCPLD